MIILPIQHYKLTSDHPYSSIGSLFVYTYVPQSIIITIEFSITKITITLSYQSKATLNYKCFRHTDYNSLTTGQ